METVAMQQNKNNRINPQLFALWVGMASMVMFFGAFTSAYIVKHAAGNWLEFPIPTLFYVSTAILVLSSVTLHLSYHNYKKQNEALYKGLLVISFIRSSCTACIGRYSSYHCCTYSCIYVEI